MLVLFGWPWAAEGDVELALQDGERRAELVGGVTGEAVLAIERGLQLAN